MDQRFKAIGLSFKNSPLEVREQFAMDEASCKRLMAFMKDFNCSELMIISTCNRTEFYFTSDEKAEKALLSSLALTKSKNKEEIEKHLVHYDEQEAIEHLFRVSIGLEAQVVGDLQIINQVKRAYQWSADENMAGPFLHRLMHTIFFTNKRVVQETCFRDGAASVAYATKELAEDLSKGITNPKIFLVGLGEIGYDVAKNFSENDNLEIYITNRTSAKAERLALECGFNVISWTDFPSFIKEADIIVSSVSAPEPIISKEMFCGDDLLSHKFFIDLSVPRSISHDLEELHGAILYNIDEIQSKASATLQKRIDAIPQVESIVHEAIDDFYNWSKEMIVSPTIQKIKNALEGIRQEAMAKYLKNADEKEVQVMDKLSRDMMQKIMKMPVLQLKAACQRGEAEKIIDLFNELFDLEKQVSKK